MSLADAGVPLKACVSPGVPRSWLEIRQMRSLKPEGSADSVPLLMHQSMILLLEITAFQGMRRLVSSHMV